VPVSTATDAGGNLDYIEKELGLDSEISSMFVELHCVSCMCLERTHSKFCVVLWLSLRSMRTGNIFCVEQVLIRAPPRLDGTK
jgi:hypothetical protein